MSLLESSGKRHGPKEATRRSRGPWRVFVSFADQDRDLKDELLNHLAILQRAGRLEIWSADQIHPGDDRKRATKEAIVGADAALLLVSAGYLAGDFTQDAEILDALTGLSTAGKPVIPIILKSCIWQEHPWISTLTPLPKSGEAIATYRGDERDRIFAEVVEAIMVGLSDRRQTLQPSHVREQKYHGTVPTGGRDARYPRRSRMTARAAWATLALTLGTLGVFATVATLKDRVTDGVVVQATPEAYGHNCGVGRQLYGGACISNKMVDFLTCLEHNGASTALRVANEEIRAHGVNEAGESDTPVRSNISRSIAALPPNELGIIMQLCKDVADAAGLTVSISTPRINSSVAPSASSAPLRPSRPSDVPCRREGAQCEKDNDCCSRRCLKNVVVKDPWAKHPSEPSTSRCLAPDLRDPWAR